MSERWECLKAAVRILFDTTPDDEPDATTPVVIEDWLDKERSKP